MINFVRFHEVNDHEGESWNYWLQVEGNEGELNELYKLLAYIEEEQGYESWFSLKITEIEPEWVVDKLVEYAEDGYNMSHNKVLGKFTCPQVLCYDEEPIDLEEQVDNLFYKGGITKHFKEGSD